MFVKHKMEVSAFTFESYNEKTTDLLQQKELKRTDRKKTQRKRLELMSINDHMKIINAIIEGHLGAEYIKIHYAITDLDSEVCKILIENYGKAGWYANYDPYLSMDEFGFDNKRALKEFWEQNTDKPKPPGGIIISSTKNLFDNSPEYLKRPYLRFVDRELYGTEIDFFIPESSTNSLAEDLILFAEYIVVELRKLSKYAHEICRNKNSANGHRLPEFEIDY